MVVVLVCEMGWDRMGRDVTVLARGFARDGRYFGRWEDDPISGDCRV